MNKLEWVILTEDYGRPDAELIKSYLDAHDVDTEFIQDGLPQHAYPSPYTRVQIFVPPYQLERAQDLLRAAGWKIDPDDE